MASGVEGAEPPLEADDSEVKCTGASKVKWTRERDIALLKIIVITSPNPFLTNQGGKPVKGKKNKTQEDIWGHDGIMGELKKLELFSGVVWPSFQSVINHITHKTSGLLAKHAHLFTSGKEQAEPTRVQWSHESATPTCTLNIHRLTALPQVYANPPDTQKPSRTRATIMT